MPKFILTLFALLSLCASTVAVPICGHDGDDEFAAFALVQASDGYVNVRENGKIIGQLDNGQMVFIFEPVMNKKGWCEIDTLTSAVSGQVHESGLKLTESFTRVPEQKRGLDSVVFANEDVQVSLKAAPFDQKKHKVVMESEWQLISIDGQTEWYGTDYTMPLSEYTSIEVKFPDETLVLPKQAYQNLFNPFLDTDDATDLATSVNYDKENDVLYIHMRNSDGAGGYFALLVIKNKRFDRQYVWTP